MERYDLYRDIAERTDGDIYIGVVGPVRTGKSTFITRFMEQMVLPAMDAGPRKDRAMDELPQSGSGRTIMTTQPKFVPNEAVPISLSDHADAHIRLVDCVGYLIKGAIGTEEDEAPRMVRTPWYEHEIPFEEAAEIGTRKVIADHATIGIMMTTDGSFTEIPRLSYLEAEERVVGELKKTGKPFVIVLNSSQPGATDTLNLRETLFDKYDVPVLVMDVMNIQKEDFNRLLESILFEFPLTEVRLELPEWVQVLPEDHWLVSGVLDSMRDAAGSLSRLRDHKELVASFSDEQGQMLPELESVSLGSGRVAYTLPLSQALFYRVLGEECGTGVYGDAHLLSLMGELVAAKTEYDRVAEALESVRRTGYGLVAPSQGEMALEEPEIVKQGNRFGVRLKASAPSLHMIRVDIQTDNSPYKMLNFELPIQRQKGNDYSVKYEAVYEVSMRLVA